MLRFLIVIIALLLCTVQLKAQVQKDSIAKARARHDAAKFKLNRADFRKFIVNNVNAASSDWFKPGRKNVSDTAMLTDSVYTSTFRAVAYQKMVDRLQANKRGNPYLASLLAGVIAVGAIAGVLVLVREIF